LKLAIAFSSKDQVDLTKQTFDRLCDPSKDFDIYWIDGSRTDEGLKYFADYRAAAFHSERVVGGADAGLAWKLSEMLKHPYTHVGLLENDCLLDEDWLDATMALFEKGKADGIEVGAVSPRSYTDRILISRGGWAVMHNLGAGVIILTREAAQLVLQHFRTGYWRDNVRLFAQLAGIDLRLYAAFRGNEDNPITTDWIWDAVLARHGLASLALTPAKCQMIGQNPPLEQQGLELVTSEVPERKFDEAFEHYRTNLTNLRHIYRLESPGVIHREGAGMLFFPHQLGNLVGTAWRGNLELQWSQGFGPFAYRAGPEGASLTARISGTCSFLATGGASGARITIEDTRSGFKTSPALPAGDQPVAIHVPGGPIPRLVTMEMDEGAVFYGLSTADPQMLDTSFRFSWDQLPVAK
jgi:hypothetical protein